MEQYKDRDWLYQKYIEEELTGRQIAKICKVSHGTIFSWLKRLEIPICSNPFSLTGERSVNWKGGRLLSHQGYVLIYSPNHPHKNANNSVREHRLIMEKYLGRYLHPWETVHHIDGNKINNKIENLELLPSRRHNTRVQEVFQENIQLKLLLISLLAIKSKL